MVRKLLAAACLLLFTPAAAHAAWHEASSKHFVVYSDDRPERLKEFATNLERFDKMLRFVHGLPDPEIGPANRLTVYVVADIAAVQKLIGGSSIAGFYKARASGSLAFVPRDTGDYVVKPISVLLHEYAHHFMMSSWPESSFPNWLVEGWAEFYGASAFTKAAVEMGVIPPERGYGLLSGNWLPIDKLLGAEVHKLKGEEFEGLYGRGWLLTHYLLNSGNRQGQFGAYLTAVNNGASALDAGKRVFGDLPALDKELERYKKGRISYHRVPNASLPIGEVTLRQLTAGEAATMAVRIVSKNGVDEKTAPDVYAKAKLAAAPYPNDAGAQLVLAEAAFDAKDYAVAEAAADRAIAANPRAVDGHLYKAQSRMETAIAKNDLSKETWSAIRKSIIAANKLDPEDPEPLILYFRSFGEVGDPPTKAAKDGLYYSVVLAPEDPGLRMMAAQLYRWDGKPDRARAILRPIANSPHGGSMADAARKIIAEIDSGKKPGAEQADPEAGEE